MTVVNLLKTYTNYDGLEYVCHFVSILRFFTINYIFLNYSW